MTTRRLAYIGSVVIGGLPRHGEEELALLADRASFDVPMVIDVNRFAPPSPRPKPHVPRSLLLHNLGHGQGEAARRRRQIERGQLKRQNGLQVEGLTNVE